MFVCGFVLQGLVSGPSSPLPSSQQPRWLCEAIEEPVEEIVYNRLASKQWAMQLLFLGVIVRVIMKKKIKYCHETILST